MTPAAEAAYAQPTPRRLYVHDDLRDEVARRFGPESPASALTAELFEIVARDRDRVRVLTLAEQLDGIIARGAHAPFGLTLGIGRAGQRVATALNARTGWFPRIRSIGLTREEDGHGGYRLVSTGPAPLREQLEGLDAQPSIAVVDDTVFSGLTMRSLLEALPGPVRARAHAFCARGVADSIAEVARLCPVTAGVAAPGRILEDVSFINASGLVLRIAIRRPGLPALAFFERPDWIRAWFPGADTELIALCRGLNRLLEPP